MVLKFTDSQLERDYANHHASLSFQTDFLFSALNGLVRVPCQLCSPCRRLLAAHDVDACYLQVWLLACGKYHNLIEGQVWAILMLKVIAGFVPPVLIWQAPTFYKRVREPLVLCLRVVTMVGAALGCLLLTCSTGPKCAGSLQFPEAALGFVSCLLLARKLAWLGANLLPLSTCRSSKC